MKRLSYSSIVLLIFLMLLNLACDKKGKVPEELVPNQNLVNLEIGPTVDISSTLIGATGGSIKVSKPDTPVDAMEILVPANSFTSSQTFKVSYSEIKNHHLGANFNPISPMISIACDGGYSATPMQVTVPIKLPEGHFAMGYFYDEATGKLEGLPVLKLSSTSITVCTRHFMSAARLKSASGNLKGASNAPVNMIISSISESVLKNQTIINSGFTIGSDDWEFINNGSYLAPKGHCAGQSITSMWYFYEKKLNGEANLFHRFDQLNQKTNPSFMWNDNPLGYKFASIIQKDFNFDDWKMRVLIQSFLPGLVFKSFAAAILVTGEPQFVLLNNSAGLGGHAMIVYKVNFNEGKLYIADPNYPNNRTTDGIESVRTIDYVGGVLKPYETGLEAGGNSVSLDQIGYFGKTAYIEWPQIGKRYSELLNNTIGTIAPNIFPPYTIWVKDGAGYELKDGLNISKDTLRTIVICPTAEVSYTVANQKLIGSIVFDLNGKQINVNEPNSQIRVILKPGINKLGYYIDGWRLSSTYTNGTYKSRFVDFKWINVNYVPLKVTADQAKGEPAKEVKFTAMTNGAAPKSAKYVWNFGDGTTPVTKTNDSTVVHTFAKVGTYSIKTELFDNTSGLKITETTVSYEVAVANAIIDILHKCFTADVTLYGDNLSTTGSSFGMMMYTASNLDGSHEIPVVWNGTTFTANGTFQDAGNNAAKSGSRTLKFTGTVSADGRTMLTFSADVSASYAFYDLTSYSETLKLAGKNVPMQSFMQKPPFSINAVIYRLDGSGAQSLMTLVSGTKVSKDKDGKVTNQSTYGSTTWASTRYVPYIEVSFSDNWY
jgi:hypothetical protein